MNNLEKIQSLILARSHLIGKNFASFKMKIILVILSVACLASGVEVEQNKVQKRSIGEEYLGGFYGGYGLSAALATPSISTVSLGAPSITSHTHTHSTAVIDRPVPIAIATPSIAAASILPSTLSAYNYNYGLGSYPYGLGYGAYPYGSSYGSYGSLGSFGQSYSNYPSFGRYYARSYPTTIYKKSFYSSPLKYKW